MTAAGGPRPGGTGAAARRSDPGGGRLSRGRRTGRAGRQARTRADGEHDADMTHYFSAEPGGPERRRTITVNLAGSGGRADHRRRGLRRRRAWIAERRCCCASRRCRPAGREFSTWAAATGRSRWPSPCTVPARRSTRSTSTARAGPVPRQRRRARASPTGSACCAPRRPIRQTRYDEIWSNPPIRIGKEALHELLLDLAAPARARGRRPAGGGQEPRRRHPAALADRAGLRLRAGRVQQGLPGPRRPGAWRPELRRLSLDLALRHGLERLGPAAVEHPAALVDPDPEHDQAGRQADRQRR